MSSSGKPSGSARRAKYTVTPTHARNRPPNCTEVGAVRKEATLIRAVSAGGTTTSVTLRFRWSRPSQVHSSWLGGWGRSERRGEVAHTEIESAHKSTECTWREREVRERERRGSGRKRRAQLRPPVVKPRRARQPAQTVLSDRIAYRLSNLREEGQRNKVPLRTLLLLLLV